jgi:dihydrofolate reductase
LIAPRLPLVLVAAVGRNGVIGGEGRLPWRLPSDLRRFKEITLGKPLMMGRRTYASIGRPLPGRETIVLTRDPAFVEPGVHVARTLEQGLALADAAGSAMGANEIIVAGGGDLYRQTIDMAERLDVTEVDLSPSGDAVFPTVDTAVWREVSRVPHPRGERDDAAFTIVVYRRR